MSVDEYLEDDGSNIFEVPNPTVLRTPFTPSLVEEPFGIQLAGAKKMHQSGLTGKGIKVAVLDSGIDNKHPLFHGKVIRKQWFRGGIPLSEADHGTHVAGTIHSMAPEAEIYDYRVVGPQGKLSVNQSIATAILEAYFDGCQIINMSLASRFADVLILNALQYVHSKGIIIVAASGNDGDGNTLTNERSFPAILDEVISVAALEKSDNLPFARFSNSNSQVDFSSMGVDVVSFKPDGGYQKMSGTSTACPFVSGFIASLISDGSLENMGAETCAILRKKLDPYAIDIGVKGPDNSTGLGYLTYLSQDSFNDVLSSGGLTTFTKSIEEIETEGIHNKEIDIPEEDKVIFEEIEVAKDEKDMLEENSNIPEDTPEEKKYVSKEMSDKSNDEKENADISSKASISSPVRNSKAASVQKSSISSLQKQTLTHKSTSSSARMKKKNKKSALSQGSLEKTSKLHNTVEEISNTVGAVIQEEVWL